MTGIELVRRLKNAGWVVNRIHGSHYIMKNGNRTETVPVHGGKDLPVGLVNAIRKRTGV